MIKRIVYPPGTENQPILDTKNFMDMARELISELFWDGDKLATLFRSNATWYQYNKSCYKEKSHEYVNSQVWQWLAKSICETKNGIARVQPNPSMVRGVIEAMNALTFEDNIAAPSWRTEMPANYLPAKDFISLYNGLLEIPTRELIRHTPNYFTLHSLPYIWDENIDLPNNFFEFLNQIWGDDQESIDTLQEIFGYLLTADNSFQKMFIILGPKRSGKGTIGRILEKLLGENNVCGGTLGTLANNFGLESWLDKLLVTMSDVRVSPRSDKQAAVERLLMISGGDKVSVDRKHRPAWQGYLSARILMLTNELPQLGDTSGALASRFICLKTSNSFYGKEDPDLGKKLENELPAILNWALQGLERLRERGRFIQPKSAMDSLEALETINSPILNFGAERCEFGPSLKISKDGLFEEWESYCLSSNQNAGTKDRFCENLLCAFPSVKRYRPRAGDQRLQYFTGIALRSLA